MNNCTESRFISLIRKCYITLEWDALFRTKMLDIYYIEPIDKAAPDPVPAELYVEGGLKYRIHVSW